MAYPKDFLVRTQAEKKDQVTIRDLEARLARGSILGPKQQNTLADAQERNKRASRRVFLGRSVSTIAGVGSIAALTAVGIDAFGSSDKHDPTSDLAIPPKTSETVAVPDKDGKKILFREIDKLPESAIKKLLNERVVPIFSHQGSTPFRATSGNFEFNVYDSFVRVNYPPGLRGSNGMYRSKGEATPVNSPRLIDNVNIQFPLNLEILSDDAPNFARAIDGITPLAGFTGTKGILFSDGITPEIVINRVDLNLVPPEKREVAETFENFLFIKEASGFLLDMLLAEESYEKMKELGIPTSIMVQGQNGQITEADTIWASMRGIQNQQGRSLVANDVGAVLLAYKALQGTRALDLIHGFSLRDAHVIDRVSGIEFGKTGGEILTSSYHFALNYPLYSELQPFTAGDITKNP